MVLCAQQKTKQRKQMGRECKQQGVGDTQGTITKRANVAKILTMQSEKASISPSGPTALDVSLDTPRGVS